MFTGIIEEIGKVKAIVRHANSIKLTIAVKKILEDIHVGDSICTNGVSEEQPLNVWLSMHVIPSGKLIVVSEEQPSNAKA